MAVVYSTYHTFDIAGTNVEHVSFTAARRYCLGKLNISISVFNRDNGEQTIFDGTGNNVVAFFPAIYGPEMRCKHEDTYAADYGRYCEHCGAFLNIDFQAV